MKRNVICACLLIVLAVFVCSSCALAYKLEAKPSSGSYYRIMSANGSGRFLDVSGANPDNGGELIIYDSLQRAQNQIFKLEKVERNSRYWKIIPNHSEGKVIEVRNSSREYGAPVGQWDYVGIACQQWRIIENSDGTVSFVNRNSGKYLDVCGNATYNGTKMIQWSWNGQPNQKFKLFKAEKNDILNASWEIDLSDEIEYTTLKWWQKIYTDVINNTGFPWKGDYYPQDGKSYLARVDYIDSDTGWDLIGVNSLKPSLKEKLADLTKGYAEKLTVKKAAKEIFKAIGLNYTLFSYIIDAAEILAGDKNNKDWNDFVNTFRTKAPPSSGKGIKRYTYVHINCIPWTSNDSYGFYTVTYWLDTYNTYQNYSWSGKGSDVQEVGSHKGEWSYTFK